MLAAGIIALGVGTSTQLNNMKGYINFSNAPLDKQEQILQDEKKIPDLISHAANQIKLGNIAKADSSFNKAIEYVEELKEVSPNSGRLQDVIVKSKMFMDVMFELDSANLYYMNRFNKLTMQIKKNMYLSTDRKTAQLIGDDILGKAKGAVLDYDSYLSSYYDKAYRLLRGIPVIDKKQRKIQIEGFKAIDSEKDDIRDAITIAVKDLKSFKMQSPGVETSVDVLNNFKKQL